MDGFFEKGSGSGGGEAESGWEGGVVARQSGATLCAEGWAGTALHTLPAQVPWSMVRKADRVPLEQHHLCPHPPLGCSVPQPPCWPRGALLTLLLAKN